MTEAAGAYAGLKPKQARTKIIEDLESGGFIEKIEEISHRTPISERSKTPIEIIPMEEYYLKQLESIEKMKKLCNLDPRDGGIEFFPEMHRDILKNWLNSISIDWPISRRRFYGTEIPIWYCKECSEPFIPEPGNYYRPWKDPCPADKCSKCDSTEFVGEERTFDTWMDSSVSPLFITKFNSDMDFHNKTYPTGIRPQAKDIVRTWLYYTLLRCEKLTGKKPWNEAWIMGYGLDETGKKMSKSKGNVLDPLPIIQKSGADTFRFWSASEVSLGYDFRCSEQKIESTKKFLSKIWNVSRFLSSFPVIDLEAVDNSKANLWEEYLPPSLTATDRWILAELEKLINECKEGYYFCDFFKPATKIREFTWNVFAAQYIEMAKTRAYGIGFSDEERDAAIYTLHEVLRTVLKLLAPITPFITEQIWQKLYSKDSIHKESFSEAKIETNPNRILHEWLERTDKIAEFNSNVWNEKKTKNLSLKDSIKIEIPKELEIFKKDLTAMHHLE